MSLFENLATLPIFLNEHTMFAFTLLGLFSLIFGSFLNVVIYRLPKILAINWQREAQEMLGLNITFNQTSYSLNRPRSCCPHCQTQIQARDNIPIISFLLLRGRCRHCANKISWQYPAVEVLMLLLTLILVWRFGASFMFGAGFIFCALLLCLSIIDLNTQLLPDQLTLPGLWLGLIINTQHIFCPLLDAVIGAVIGYLSLWIFAKLFQILTKRQGMGHGDFKLLAVLGAWLGWQLLPFIILSASLVGAICGISYILITRQNKSIPIPFGPYLALAGIMALFFGQDITHWYLGFLSLSPN